MANRFSHITIRRHFAKILIISVAIMLVLFVMIVVGQRNALLSELESRKSNALIQTTSTYYSYLVAMLLHKEPSEIDNFLKQTVREEGLLGARIVSSKEEVESIIGPCEIAHSMLNPLVAMQGCYAVHDATIKTAQELKAGSIPLGYLIKVQSFRPMSIVVQIFRRPALLIWLIIILLFGIFYAWELQRYLVDPLMYLSKNARTFLSKDAKGKYKLIELETLANALSAAHSELVERSQLATIGSMSSHIAHDMRSPISVLSAYMNMKDDLSAADAAELKGAAQRSVGKLVHMADDLVDYAKADKVEHSKSSLRDIVCGSVVTETKKDADDAGVLVRCEGEQEISANVDSYRVERVLVNLVKNAIQASRRPQKSDAASAEVLLRVSSDDDALTISVQDNGKGIAQDDLAHIFDSFFTKGKKGGTGLGLAYCKQVVEAHGGTIDVQSEVGKGTTFTIVMPNCVVETFPVLGNKVLIADDDELMRSQWQRIVKQRGGTVVYTASSTSEVLGNASIDYASIDTAIVDYQFVGEDKTGVDLIAYLKSKGVKTVHLCTGFAHDETIVAAAKKAGAASVIPKPVDEGQFV